MSAGRMEVPSAPAMRLDAAVAALVIGICAFATCLYPAHAALCGMLGGGGGAIAEYKVCPEYWPRVVSGRPFWMSCDERRVQYSSPLAALHSTTPTQLRCAVSPS